MFKKSLIGASVFALAIPMIVSAQAATPVTTNQGNGLNVSCIQTAIAKRDTALSADMTTFSTSIISALSARSTALQAAIALPTRTERVAARTAAYTAFKTSTTAAHTTLKASRTNEWTTYSSDVKACGSVNLEAPAAVGATGVSL